ncbi:hypothetical protein [Pseudomonas nitroreducens]|uniref:hypothetical protein n=1 Tax=Pseudomonas nitroreducens TaxID=46680 RepID=UPI002657EEA7|nr:hypothetical protein [Pseudomonas nitroreducens]MCP1652695.1 LysB family phage lysis regulatory protein [Pseudomonas nitroreducens]
MTRVLIIGAGLLVAGLVAALWRADHLGAQLEVQGITAERDALVVKAEADALLIEHQGAVIEVYRQELEKASALEAEMRKVSKALGQQSRENREQFEELKRNDQDVADWLRGAVPAALGRMYERTATTVPVAYRAGAALPADGVRATSPPPDQHQ